MNASPDRLAALIAELRALLEQEREAFLSGSPERIASVAQQKLALAAAIEREAARPGALTPSADRLAALARYNRENGVICAAMLRHMTQALDTLRRCEPHRSYRPDGTEHNPPVPHTLGAA
jgi:flagellar biosynthesis/type III secretory pathway chaperone